jgi:membrane-associated phospholipid phosphatase
MRAGLDLIAQSPYVTRWDNELVYTGAGIAALGTGVYLRNRITLFTPEELERLDRYNINELDRRATHNLSLRADGISDYFTQISQVTPLLFLSGRKTRKHFGQIAMMYGETILINGGVTTVLKYAIRRPRPFVYNEESSISRIQSLNAQSSFVSGHTSSAAAATFFMARVYADFHPDSEWRPVVWTAAAAIPAVTGYLRVRAGKHYPTDVIGGYVLGAAVGYLVPHFHLNKKQTSETLRLSASPGLLHLNWTF